MPSTGDDALRPILEEVGRPAAVVAERRFQCCNGRLAALLEYGAPADLEGTSLDAVHADGVDVPVDGVDDDGEFWSGTVTVQPRGGGPVDRNLTLRPLGDGRVLYVLSGVGPDRPARFAFASDVVNAFRDLVYVVDESDRAVLMNDAATELLGYDLETLATMEPTDLLPPHEHDILPEEGSLIDDLPDRRVVEFLTADDEVIPLELNGQTITDSATGERYRVGVGRDVTERLERERALKRQRDELAALTEITELLLDIVEALVETTDRSDLERVVCEGLAGSERYRFAWIGTAPVDGGAVTPRTVAGEADGYLEAIDLAGADPAVRVSTSESAAVSEVEPGTADGGVDSHATAVDAYDDWTDAAADRGVESAAGIPLAFDGTVYGVLGIYADERDAFGAREVEHFAALGRTIGFVVSAIRRRELLYADAAVEIEFAVSSRDSLLAAVAASTGCELSLAGYAAVGDEWVVYVDVEGADPEGVLDAVPDERISTARVVNGGEDRGRVEATLRDSPVFDAVETARGTIRSATADPDGGRIAVQLPASADVREVRNRIASIGPDVSVVARREYDRAPTDAGLPPDTLETLTDRQREVLEVAFRAGYFEWPRDSTAEQVADALDITASTLHSHLRKGLHAMLTEHLD